MTGQSNSSEHFAPDAMSKGNYQSSIQGKHRYRLLLIDDDSSEHFLLNEMLDEIRNCQYELSSCTKPEEGIEAVKSGQYDMVLLDQRMTAMTGLDVLRELGEWVARVPVVMLTGYDDHDTDISAMRAGAVDFIYKDDLNPRLLERVIRYVTHNHENQQLIIEREQQYRLLADHSNDMIILMDEHGELKFVSPACSRLLGYSSSQMEGLSYLELVHAIDYRHVEHRLLEARDHGSATITHRLRKNDLGYLWVESSMSWAAPTESDQEQCLVIGVRDVTERIEQEERVRYRAMYDEVTGLLNRGGMEDRISEFLSVAESQRTQAALIYLDLDQFQVLRQHVGQREVDKALSKYAGKLAALIDHSMYLSRYGESIILCMIQGDSHMNQLLQVTTELKQCEFASDLMHALNLSPKVNAGICRYNSSIRNIDDWIAAAESAMKCA